MKNLRLRFWEVVGVLTQTEWLNSGLTDEEYEQYDRFMIAHGFPVEKRR